MRRDRSKTQSGQALVEFALSFASLAILGIGALSFGLAVQTSEVLADAANAGALYGANSTYDSVSTTTGYTWPNFVGIQAVVLQSASGVRGLNTTPTVSYWCTCNGAVVACSYNCSGDQPLAYVTVIVSASYPNFFHYGGLPATFTIQSSSTMPVE